MTEITVRFHAVRQFCSRDGGTVMTEMTVRFMRFGAAFLTWENRRSQFNWWGCRPLLKPVICIHVAHR